MLLDLQSGHLSFEQSVTTMTEAPDVQACRAGVGNQVAPAIPLPASCSPAAPAGPVDRHAGPPTDPGFAPAGYGKTALISHWLDAVAAHTPGSLWTSRITIWPPSCSTLRPPFVPLSMMGWPGSSSCSGHPRSSHPSGWPTLGAAIWPPSRSVDPRARRLSCDQGAGNPCALGPPDEHLPPHVHRGPDHTGRSTAAL